ncbi:hypothetical protein BGW42_002981 [Actinomortierella wolfii]|nr:hypothetical protein BGW42_002981 [Actinomortierella wolfii]
MYTAPRPVSGEHLPDNSKTCLDDEEYAYPIHASYRPHQHLHHTAQQYHHHQQQFNAHPDQQNLHPSSLLAGNGHDRRLANLSTGSDLVQVTVEDLLISDQQDLHARNSYRKQQVSTHAANPIPGTTTSFTATIVSPPSSTQDYPPRAELVFEEHGAVATGQLSTPGTSPVPSPQPRPVATMQNHSQFLTSSTPPALQTHGSAAPAQPQTAHATALSVTQQPYATQDSHRLPQGQQHQQQPSSSSSSTGPKPLTPAQQREAELDDLIQKGIELHEANKLVEAFGYFEKAAKGENPLGQLMYGLSLRHGWGCHPNPQKALTYLQKAAEYAMGELNELGPVKKPGSLDPVQSKSSLSSSSSHRHSPSASSQQSNAAEDARRTLRRMGTMDRKMAIMTARTELVMALFELGMSFMKGWGVAKDKTIGFNYFKIAADLGDADSQNEVALCYQDGIGTEKDMFQAAKYYRLAAKQGAGQMGNQWIWKPKYDQYCNAEAAAAQSVEQRKRSKSSAASFPFTSSSSASSPSGSPPNSSSSSSTSPSKNSSFSISGIAAGLASVTAATAGAASPTATRQSMLRSAPISSPEVPSSAFFASSSPPTPSHSHSHEPPVSLMSQMNLAGDLITSTSHQYQQHGSTSSGEKKKHRWSLFPSSRSSQMPSSGHPSLPSSPPRG